MSKRRLPQAVLVLLLTACSSRGGAAASGTSVPPSSISVKDLNAQLISLSNLPPGWRVDSHVVVAPGSSSCTQPVKAPLAASVRVNFSGPNNGQPLLGEQIIVPSDGAAAGLARFRSEMTRCRQVRFSDGGDSFSGTNVHIVLPSFGDGSSGYQQVLKVTTSNGAAFTLSVDLVAIREGREIANLVFVTPGSPDESQVATFALLATKLLG